MDTFHLADREPVAVAIAAAAACNTLDELYAAIRDYRGHDVPDREPYMPSQQTRHANPIMVITEKPEREDHETGIPFSGDYGGLMRSALKRAGVAQEDLHIAYALHWTPDYDNSPTKTQLSASRPFLYREIELVQPRVIMAQGKKVIESLNMYRGNIMPIVGQTMAWKRGGASVQAYITYHPAYPLRISQEIPEFFSQVETFFDRFGRPGDEPALQKAA